MNKITHSSELMKNQLAATVLPARSQFEALQTGNGNALFFSISDNGRFYMSVERNDAQIGWNGINLCDGLPNFSDGKSKAKKFAVSQNMEDGTITIALAVSMNGEKSDQLFIMNNLKDKPDAEWLDPGGNAARKWIPRIFEDHGNAETGLDIAYVHLSKTAEPGNVPILIAGLRDDDSDMIQNYVVETNAARKTGIWKKFQTAEDYSQMHSLHIGKPSVSRYAGMYELYAAGDDISLTFTPLKSIYGTSNVLKLTPPEGASALGVSQVGKKENTDLYVAGDAGVHLYASENQTNFANGIRIVESNLFKGAGKLYVHTVNGKIVLFAKNSMGQLVYAQCKHENRMNAKEWSCPVPIQANVEQITSYLNKKNGAEEIFIHLDGQRLERYSRDPVTTAWKKSAILLESLEDVIEFHSYTTNIMVRDEDEIPLPNTRVKIKPSSPCGLYINHKYFFLHNDESIEIATDFQGKITIVQKTIGLRCVSLAVEIPDSPPIAISPMKKIHQKLKNAEDLSSIVVTDEKGNTAHLLPKDLPDDQKEAVNRTVSQLNAINVSEGGILTTAPGNDLPSETHIWGADHRDGGFDFYQGNDAMQAFGLTANPDGSISMKRRSIQLDDIIAESIELAVGDLFSWIKHAFEDVARHIIAFFDGAYHLLIEIGGLVYRCVLETVGDVLDGIAFVFQKIEVGVGKLVQWLGYIFSWNDILLYQRLFYHMLDLMRKKVLTDIDGLETQIEDGIRQFKLHIDKMAGLDTSHDMFQQKTTEAVKSAAKKHPQSSELHGSPVLNWIYDHTLAYLDVIKIDPDNLQELLDEIGKTLEDLAQKDIAVFDNALKELYNEVIKNIKSLTIQELFQKLGAIISKLIVELAGDLAITLLQAAKIVIEAIWLVITTEINVPVISTLYKRATEGGKLSLLNLACLMGAIPAQVGCRIVGMPCPSQASIDSFLNTESLEDFIYALENEKITKTGDNQTHGDFRKLSASLQAHMETSDLSTNTPAENRINSSATWVDWVFVAMEFGRSLLYVGVALGDNTEGIEGIITPETSEKEKLPTAIKIIYLIRSICSLLMTVFSIFRLIVAIHRKIGNAFFIIVFLVFMFLFVILDWIILLGKFIKKKWEKISPYFNVLDAVVSVILGFVSMASAIVTVIDRLKNRNSYYGDTQEGQNLCTLDCMITLNAAVRTLVRVCVSPALIMNKYIGRIDPEPETQIETRAIIMNVIFWAGPFAIILSLVNGIIYSIECSSGRSIDVHALPFT